MLAVTNINSCKSSTATNKPRKVRTWVMALCDIGAIVCAMMPLAYVVFVVVSVPKNDEDLSDRFITKLFILFGAACFLWLVSAIYNVIGCLQRRIMAFIGTLVTFVSFGIILLCLL
ncbi:MAG: hypothetical protein K8R36_14280 [Planctomycetales bacterium]|nr:hypothetical protein [Planctomycetales bacterium]